MPHHTPLTAFSTLRRRSSRDATPTSALGWSRLSSTNLHTIRPWTSSTTPHEEPAKVSPGLHNRHEVELPLLQIILQQPMDSR